MTQFHLKFIPIISRGGRKGRRVQGIIRKLLVGPLTVSVNGLLLGLSPYRICSDHALNVSGAVIGCPLREEF